MLREDFEKVELNQTLHDFDIAIISFHSDPRGQVKVGPDNIGVAKSIITTPESLASLAA